MKKNLYIIFLLLGIACQQAVEQDDTYESQDHSVEAQQESVSLNQEKLELADIRVGKIKMDVVSESVTCNGTITAPPDKLITVSAPMGGFVSYTKYLPGDYVRKGMLLVKLKHPEYIALQQQYLDTQSQLEYARQDYERQRMLADQEAVSQKKRQQATATYQSLQAKRQGLEAQLEFIGISPQDLVSKGIQSEISLYAPITGYVTEAHGNLGRFVNSEAPLYEILDKAHLHLELNVYEKDVDKIQVGQQVQFYLNENPDRKYEGTVKLIGQKMEPETKTFDLHVDMVSPPDFLKLGMYARAQVLLLSDSVATLPSEAFVREGDQFFVFVKDKNAFRKTEVQTGAQWENLVEIKNPQPLLDSLLVVDGAYYLNAEMAN